MRSLFFSCYCTLLLIQCCSLQYVSAFDWFPSNDEAVPEIKYAEAEPRLFFNASAPLSAYNATTIATVGGAIAFFALNSIFILTFLTPKSAKSSKKTAASTNEQYEYYDEDDYNFNYDEVATKKKRRSLRSANDGYDYNGLNIIQWISMLQDLYEKFDYNDLDCQKRLICEVMREPEYYGNMAQKFKSGFQYAKYLEVLSLPDDMRELLDEYLDANSRAEQQKACEEFFQCPYSIKDSVKRNLNNSL